MKRVLTEVCKLFNVIQECDESEKNIFSRFLSLEKKSQIVKTDFKIIENSQKKVKNHR
jgi:hypothetical protein